MNTSLLPRVKRHILDLLDLIDDMDVDSSKTVLERTLHTLYMAAGDVTDNIKHIVAADSPTKLQSLDDAVGNEEAQRVADADAAVVPEVMYEHRDNLPQRGEVWNVDQWVPCTVVRIDLERYRAETVAPDDQPANALPHEPTVFIVQRGTLTDRRMFRNIQKVQRRA